MQKVLLTLGTSYELVEDLPDNHWKSLSAEIRNADLVAPETETDVMLSLELIF